MAATPQNQKPVEVKVVKEGAPLVDATQPVETDAYVPTYKVRPELKPSVLKAIGKYPFNQIASIMNAVNVEVMDHNSLNQVINVLGNFPYQDVAGLIAAMPDLIELIVED